MSSFNYFASLFNTLDPAKARNIFLKLARQHHPDKGGDTQTMQNLNNAYKNYLAQTRNPEVNQDQQNEIDKDLIEKVNLLIKYHDLEIEILGSWIWVTGNTIQHKEDLKASGFFYSPKKLAWYYYKENQDKSRSRGDFSLDEIRGRHGLKFTKKTLKLAVSPN
jgi:hypothetical protein